MVVISGQNSVKSLTEPTRLIEPNRRKEAPGLLVPTIKVSVEDIPELFIDYRYSREKRTKRTIIGWHLRCARVCAIFDRSGNILGFYLNLQYQPRQRPARIQQNGDVTFF